MGWTFLFYNIRQLDRELHNLDRESFVESLLASRENSSIWQDVNHTQDYIKFVLVRHPLARLYEAWEMQYKSPNSDKKTLNKLSYHGQETGFGSALDTDFNSHRGHYGHSSHYETTYNNKDSDWKAFINNFAENLNHRQYKIDEHFTPIDKHCQLCQAPIDLVLKIETIQTDTQVLDNILSKRLDSKIYLAMKNSLSIKEVSD